MATPKSATDIIRKKAENSLFFFAKLVGPKQVYGHIHEELMDWMTKSDAKNNQLILLPRAHRKSHILALWCAWYLTKYPHKTILYISATADLAEKQLYAIKNILESPVYRRYWEDMTNQEVGKRERWTTSEISVDHPKRKEEAIRDPSIKAVGLTSNTTGAHADIIAVDDAVVPDNAYTEEGRRKVSAALSQMASIKNVGGITKSVGTRYHPKDQYDIWKKQSTKQYDENGNYLGREPTWEIFERVVEEDGEFLWPRQMREDGNYFGFDLQSLAEIEAEYTDRTQFYAQYYNNPNDPDSAPIQREWFQYYNKKVLENNSGYWYFREEKLNIYAAIDFAFSLNMKADYTAIAVIGIDSKRNIYVLDMDRFKTDRIITYYEHIKNMHLKWDFRKLRAEVNVAQDVIVKELRQYLKEGGISITIDDHRPVSGHGKKEERITNILQPKYSNRAVWHYKGGNCQILEEELVMSNPPHDDCKDVLASVIETATPPSRRSSVHAGMFVNKNVSINSRFGGVSF